VCEVGQVRAILSPRPERDVHDWSAFGPKRTRGGVGGWVSPSARFGRKFHRAKSVRSQTEIRRITAQFRPGSSQYHTAEIAIVDNMVADSPEPDVPIEEWAPHPRDADEV